MAAKEEIFIVIHTSWSTNSIYCYIMYLKS